MTRIKLENVTKVFGNTIAVDNVSLEINEGEFFTIIGPSGCGKTTTLRIIAGFELPEQGKIYFDDQDVTYLKPYHRNTAMVFQNYALWPHMTVYDNIAYGLRLRKVPEEEIKKRVKWALELVDLEGVEKRYPLQLSGGQQQRVALARALVVEPNVLLLDEPLSNLDAKLRVEMREEIKSLQKRLKITTVYVTHDQLEALSMSDRIAVMNKGKVLQIDTPTNLYFKPNSLFVASFLGRSNVLEGRVTGTLDNNMVRVYVDQLDKELIIYTHGRIETGKVHVVIRPESFELVEDLIDRNNIIEGVIEDSMFLGDKIEARVISGPVKLTIYLPNKTIVRQGQKVMLHIPPDRMVALPA